MDILEFSTTNKSAKDYSNLAMMENYGMNQMSNPSDPNFPNNVLQWRYDYDYSINPSATSNYDTNSFWENLATPVRDASAYVWDSAAGTWESVKSSAVESASYLANAVDSAGNKIGDVLTEASDGILKRIVLIFVILVAALWVLARAGVIKDVASIFVTTR